MTPTIRAMRAAHVRGLKAAIGRAWCRWSTDDAGQWRSGCGQVQQVRDGDPMPRTCAICGRAVRLDVARNKYAAKRTVIDGITFDSRREGRRYQALKALERAGVIEALEIQVPYPIQAVNLDTGEIVTVGRYVADFRYRWIASGLVTVEDAKGFKTPVYRLKKKLIEATHAIRIVEV